MKIKFLLYPVLFLLLVACDPGSSSSSVAKHSKTDRCMDLYGLETDSEYWSNAANESPFLEKDIKAEAEKSVSAYSFNLEVRSIEYDLANGRYEIFVMNNANSPSAHNYHIYAKIEGCSFYLYEDGDLSEYYEKRPSVKFDPCFCDDESGVAFYRIEKKSKKNEDLSSSQSAESSSSLKISSSTSSKVSSSEKIYSSSAVESSSSGNLLEVDSLFGCDSLNCVNMKFLNQDLLEDSSYGVFVDERDLQVYRTIRIGGDVWLAQNLNYKAEGSRCYNDDPDMCEIYGHLYDWNTAMNGLCPTGWKLPSTNDFQNLLDGFISDLDLLSEDFFNGTNLSGFSAAPAGEYYQGFIDIDMSATYWSSESASETMAYYWFYNYRKSTTISRIDAGGDKAGYKSVRCIMN